MKKLAFLFISAVLIFGCADNKSQSNGSGRGLAWTENLEQAIEVAKNEDKNILINFTGSDWCKWCFKLDGEVFSKKEFAAYADENLVLVKLDFPRTIKQSEAQKYYNRNLKQKYGVRGYPTIVLLDKNGEMVNVTGYQPGGAEKYVEHIEKIYKKR